MAYTAISQMSKSQGLYERISACAAEQGLDNPPLWASQHVWAVVARSDWVAAWEYAEDTKTVNQNPDTGARSDVISDAQILTAVQQVAGIIP